MCTSFDSKIYCAFFENNSYGSLLQKDDMETNVRHYDGAVISALERMMEQLHPMHEKKSEDNRVPAAQPHHHGSVYITHSPRPISAYSPQ